MIFLFSFLLLSQQEGVFFGGEGGIVNYGHVIEVGGKHPVSCKVHVKKDVFIFT